MARCGKSLEWEGLDNSLGKLITAQLNFGQEALNFISTGCGTIIDNLGNCLPKADSCCDIPEPCWMPKNLGEICCEIGAGDVGELCLVIGNGDFKPRRYRVHARGEDINLVTISEPGFELGAKERKLVSVKFKMPEKQIDQSRPVRTCCESNDYEFLIWIEGCSNHYLRWYLNRSKKHKECCNEVCVDDKPDYELHWYDHFHVPQPCFGPLTNPNK